MTTPPWDEDERTLAELVEAIGATPTGPERMRGAGEAAYAWHGVDAELEFAGLVYDSVLDPGQVVRGVAERRHRTVLFKGGRGSVEIERTGDTLVGQLIPPERGEISLVAARGPLTHADLDGLGCFCLDAVPTGPVKIRCRTATLSLVTDWIRL
jgi:hypothetical protein